MGSLPVSIFPSTVPAMKKLSEMYKLYREVPMFAALYSSLLELLKMDLLPEELVASIVHEYDQRVMYHVKASQDQYNLTGKLVMYRILQDHYWFVLSNVSIYQQLPPGSETNHNKRKKATKLGKRVGKFDKLKLWAHDPISDSTLTQVVKEDHSSPYVVEVEKVKKIKKVKIKLEKKKATPMGYNPLIHTSLLGKRSKDMQEEDFSRPMPYNEKLRRARNVPESVMAIANSQVGKVDVLKGKFRKKVTEYPYRCVESEERKVVDMRVVSGRNIVRRDYIVLMRSQDKFLSEMTMGAGGTLALMAHNIHVAEEVMEGEERVVVRDSYGTRRKNKIEHATFDTVKNYAVVREEPKKRVDTDSDSSEDTTSDEEFSTAQFPERKPVGRPSNDPERRCRPKSRQANIDSREHLLLRVEDRNVEVEIDMGTNKFSEDKVINELKITNEVDDDFGFLDDLVREKGGEELVNEQLAIDKMLDLALLDGNNNLDDEMAVDQLGIDENILRQEALLNQNEDGLQGGVLDMFNENIFSSTLLTELNQTLDTDM